MTALLAHCRAAVFDAYGTLFDVHSAVAQETAALGAKAEAVSLLWRQKQLEYTWLRSLMGRHADFWQVTRDGLDFALASHGIDDPALADRLMQLYLRLDAYPDAAPLLARLKAARRTSAILSNGTPAMIKAAAAASGLALDHLISIEATGIYKPHPAVYQLAVDLLGPASQICFVSTNSWDARGAAAYGLQVVWLDRWSRMADRLPGEFRATIKTLDDLPALLGLD
ncbi:MAG TPA: haloacid dehalogenase type II [Kiloniellales bacterium]|nr:haloacid dehalogenase type II [Kiloniellales bacterium]